MATNSAENAAASVVGWQLSAYALVNRLHSQRRLLRLGTCWNIFCGNRTVNRFCRCGFEGHAKTFGLLLLLLLSLMPSSFAASSRSRSVASDTVSRDVVWGCDCLRGIRNEFLRRISRIGAGKPGREFGGIGFRPLGLLNGGFDFLELVSMYWKLLCLIYVGMR